MRDFNATRAVDKYAGRKWLGHEMPVAAGPSLNAAVDATPFSDELVQALALRALAAENLGTGPKTDLLAVSYSGVDYVGHRDGPDSPEIADMVKRVDKLIGALIQAAEARTGQGRVLVVMSADHGVTPLPEDVVKRGLPAGRIKWEAARKQVEAALNKKFGTGKWIDFSADGVIYFSPDPIPGTKLDMAKVQQVAADAIRTEPGIARVYTRTQLAAGVPGKDAVDRLVRNGFNPERSPDVYTVTQPNYIFNGAGTTHGSPYEYDTHVPVMFLGASIRPGRYTVRIGVQDVAPTLSRILAIATPSGSMGHVLKEMLK